MVILAYFKKHISVFLIVFFTILFPKYVLAQETKQIDKIESKIVQSSSISIKNLIEIALDSNPSLIVMRREFDVTRARIPQAKALPDPIINFGNTTVGNPIPFTGLSDDFNDFYLGFSQELPWFGVRRLRGQVASSESEAKFQEYQTVIKQLKAEVKLAAYELYYLDCKLTVIKRDIEILKNFALIAEARYSVGKTQQVDVINARVEIAELLDEQGTLEIERQSMVARLNHLLYRDQETHIESLAEIKPNLILPSLNELVDLALENAPELKQHKRKIDASNHSLRLAEREAKYPEVSLQFTYHKRIDFPDYYTYGVSLKLPLYAFNKQRYAVAEQSAELAAAKSRLTSTASMIRYKLSDAHSRASKALKLIKLNQEAIIPQATLALESAIAAYQVGQVDFLTLLTTLKRAVNYEIRYYQLLADYQKALAEMETFVGVELTD